ncbi:MAG: hypothetical protein IKE25_04570, partial [Clostridia bacterium]|nr:hypothetical protein [Clostridia bacterium]
MKGSVLKSLFSALGGLTAAAAVGAAMGTWGLMAERDLLYVLGPVRITVSGIGAALSLLTLIAFAYKWFRWKQKRTSEESGMAVSLLDGFGFGLLPSIAIWKCFEHFTRLGKGTAMMEGFPPLPRVTDKGMFQSARLEALIALALFAAVIIWLMVRKKELPAMGDLAGVSLTLWCGVRLITEGVRISQPGIGGLPPVMGWLAAADMLICLLIWMIRGIRTHQHPGYILACPLVWVGSIALIVLIRNQMLLFDHPVAEMIIILCSALLAIKAVLCMGRISRA